MTDPVRFLHAFAQALSGMALYPAGHPSREHGIDRAYEDLAGLFATEACPPFTFLDGEVLFGREALRDLGHWDWSSRLAASGVSRIEFDRVPTRDQFDGFLEEVHLRLTHADLETSGRRQMRDLGVRFGSVALEFDRPGEAVPVVPATGGPELAAEVDTYRWLEAQVSHGHAIPMAEAEGVVRSLAVAMHADYGMWLPLIRLKEFDQYTTTHALNVSVLSMALAEALGASRREVRAAGVAGLLHDVGKTKIPLSLLTKPGRLTDEERAIMNHHPVDGARLILQSDEDLSLAAVVAYEHHIRLDGGGYPVLHYPRPCALGSRLVHVCDVYDALSTRRPYREAWPQLKTLAYLEERAGTEFDAALVATFAAMMRRSDVRLQDLGPDGGPVAGEHRPGA
ncbi:MAG: HD domain-containing protein [Vicinamibacterales bacterium]